MHYALTSENQKIYLHEAVSAHCTKNMQREIRVCRTSASSTSEKERMLVRRNKIHDHFQGALMMVVSRFEQTRQRLHQKHRQSVVAGV